jgi:SAM-dependent methyltransferase
VIDEPAELSALRGRLAVEEQAYAEALAALDRLSDFKLPLEQLVELPAQMQQLNELWSAATPPEGAGVGDRARRAVWDAVQPALIRQQSFNATLVQVLNLWLAESARIDARFRDVAAALTRYAQRLLPTVDARDRVASALGTTRAELILEAFDRRQEALARRLEGLLALRDRVDTLTAEMTGVRGALAAAAPAPQVAAQATQAAQDAGYVAFEMRFRGSREEIRARLEEYVAHFAGLAPVADLGCGRGEFLELLREAGIAGVGVDGNAGFVQECRAKGLDVFQGDLVAFLRGREAASLGGICAVQVAEHLPPPVLSALLREAHRVLRPGGLLLLETVNPRSLVGVLEVFNRDLTHEKPLHPETLSFLAAAAGFSDVRVELRSPVEADARLQPVPSDDLPPRVAEALNENVARLNGLLYGPREYALFARR